MTSTNLTQKPMDHKPLKTTPKPAKSIGNILKSRVSPAGLATRKPGLSRVFKKNEK
jgi:hypothetical protein